ncbi:hypothetical protein [Campylobacter lanienae]|uniref:hypothetical protein n=1 Tax=Campylobacter lanienae TaxID=75658 RepID=UPI000BB4207B|nr:hypothetical protein [Campylobacter lanienae]
MRKKLISAITAISLTTTSLQSSGIPTIDVAAIAQAILGYVQQGKDYVQQVQQFEQMVKDTANFQKHMDELGIGMSINDILKDTMNMVRDFERIYNEIENMPKDFLRVVNKIENACSFLERESQFFGIEINKGRNLGKLDTLSSCISVIEDETAIMQTLEELINRQNNTTNSDEYYKLAIEIDNIKSAKRYLEDKNQVGKFNELIRLENLYQTNTSGISVKQQMREEIFQLNQALQNPNNAKQAQALTNSILIKILETNQRLYELTMASSTAMASINQNGGSEQKKVSEEDYQKVYKKYDFDANLAYGNNVKTAPKDDVGLPIFQIQ